MVEGCHATELCFRTLSNLAPTLTAMIPGSWNAETWSPLDMTPLKLAVSEDSLGLIWPISLCLVKWATSLICCVSSFIQGPSSPTGIKSHVWRTCIPSPGLGRDTSIVPAIPEENRLFLQTSQVSLATFSSYEYKEFTRIYFSLCRGSPAEGAVCAPQVQPRFKWTVCREGHLVQPPAWSRKIFSKAFPNLTSERTHHYPLEWVPPSNCSSYSTRFY